VKDRKTGQAIEAGSGHVIVIAYTANVRVRIVGV
jgi:hypothetical protein